MRKHIEQVDDTLEDDEVVGDDFENLYKGEISKSGVPILPSKRARKVPDKIQVLKEEINTEDLSQKNTVNETEDLSLEELKDEEDKDITDSESENINS